MRDYFEIISQFLAGETIGRRIFGGSERQFYRVPCGDDTCIILIDANAQALMRYATILKYLHHRNIPVPRVFAIDETTCTMAMEDIGDISLFDWYRATGDIEPHFRATHALAKIHAISDVPEYAEPEFDVADLLFETSYFTRHFLVGFCDFPERINDALADEFEMLAHRAARSPKGLMHRDYQSQNIFISRGGVRIVDFQGERRGFIAYDLASLVEDPYLELCKAHRRQIFREYLAQSRMSHIEHRASLQAYPYLALQRLLQATAAFAYLSSIQGKMWFQKFILPSLHRASDWLQLLGEFPIMFDVLQEARTRAFMNIRANLRK